MAPDDILRRSGSSRRDYEARVDGSTRMMQARQRAAATAQMNDALLVLLNAERAGRVYGDVQEAQARIAADNAERDARVQADADEATTRHDADNLLASMVDAVSTALANEAQARQQADAAAVTARDQAIAALNLGSASQKPTAYFEPAIAPGTTAQFWRGNKTWAAIAIADVSGLFAALTGLSDAYKAADALLDTKINGRLKRVSLGNVTVSWGLTLLALGIRNPVDLAVTGIRTDDVLVELRPTAPMPAGYALMQAYIKANGTLTTIFYTPSLTVLSPMVSMTFEVVVLRSGA